MKLVPADTPYSEAKSNLSAEEHELSRSGFSIIQAFRLECSEHDEDPGFDADDALSALMKSFGFGRKLAAHFMEDPNVPKDTEAITHGIVRNLGILDEQLIARTHEPVPGANVTEDTPGEPPAPEPEPETPEPGE